MEENKNTEEDEDSAEHYLQCNICESVCYKRHCKIVCPKCGVIRDCSDPFY